MFAVDRQTAKALLKPYPIEESDEHKTLWNRREGCVGEVVCAPGGGVKCTKCPGWFCY